MTQDAFVPDLNPEDNNLVSLSHIFSLPRWNSDALQTVYTSAFSSDGLNSNTGEVKHHTREFQKHVRVQCENWENLGLTAKVHASVTILYEAWCTFQIWLKLF